MAGWTMQRRLLSIFTGGNRPHISFRHESSSHLLPAVNSFLHSHESYTRRIQTLSEPSNQTVENTPEHESSSPKPIENPAHTGPLAKNGGVTFTAQSELKISPRHDLAMMFTCKVCETRSVKTLSRESYERGVVVARCGGCDNYHLIADHLGMFGEKGCVEDILAARGEEVRRGDSETLNLTLEDLVGMAKS